MYDLQTIKRMNKERAEEAQEKRLQPFLIENKEQIDSFNQIPFPNLGDFRPKGWELVETHFVDNSGFGRNDELALSVNQFLKKLKVGFAYGIIEAGQFQVYVGEFKRVEVN